MPLGDYLYGGIISTFLEGLPPSPKWSTDDIPDLTGRVMLVTGGNSGIGKETVQVRHARLLLFSFAQHFNLGRIQQALLEHNAKVYLAARSQERAEKAIQELKQVTGREAIYHHLDLSSLANIRKSAAEFIKWVHFDRMRC